MTFFRYKITTANTAKTMIITKTATNPTIMAVIVDTSSYDTLSALELLGGETTQATTSVRYTIRVAGRQKHSCKVLSMHESGLLSSRTMGMESPVQNASKCHSGNGIIRQNQRLYTIIVPKDL